MKRWLLFLIVVLLAAGGLVLSEKRKVEAPVRPDPVVYFVGDTQRELTRLPMAFTRLSDEEETGIGDRLASMYTRRMIGGEQEAESRVIESYLQRVGGVVAGRAHRMLAYRFHYVPDASFINAFALPGGHVLVGAGLLALMDTEDELAAVLGHEVEHIDHYHCAERVQTEAALRKVPLGELLALPVEVFQAGYSKDQELEADREGTRLTVMASYSPLGAVRMFETFDRLFREYAARARTPAEELEQVSLQALEEYFRTHPPAQDRIAQIRRMISDEHWENRVGERRLEVAYVFLTHRAHRALGEKKYIAARDTAVRSLELHPDQPAAVETLAEAQFALASFDAAALEYRRLLEKYPEKAEAIETFAVTLASEAFKKREFGRAELLASHALDLQPNERRALRVLVLAELALEKASEASATGRKLAGLYPDEVARVVADANELAAWADREHQFEQAAKAAEFSLEFTPKQPEMLEMLARVELEQANFDAAARALRRLLDLEPVTIAKVENYADALAGTRRGRAAVSEFQSWAREAKFPDKAAEAEVKVESAGLGILAGDPLPAKTLVADAKGLGEHRVPPETLGRLAWWFYRAGDYAQSADLLTWALRQRPADSILNNDMAWTDLETRRFQDALDRFAMAYTGSFGVFVWNDPAMGRAIALWQMHGRPEEAMAYFERAVQSMPLWLNQRLVEIYYPSLVVRSIQEMKGERERRLAAHQHPP